MKGKTNVFGEVKLEAKRLMLGKSRDAFAMAAVSTALLLLAGNLPLLAEMILGRQDVKGALADAYVWLSYASAVCSAIAWVLIASALRFGREYRYRLAVRGHGKCSEALFYFFSPKRIFHCCFAWCVYSLVRVFRFLVFQTPALCTALVLYSLMKQNGYPAVSSVVILTGIGFLFVCGCVFTMIHGSGEQIFFDIMLEYPKINPFRAIKLSREYADGMLFDIAKFKLSFTPWLLLGAFVFPAFYISAYYRQSLVLYMYRIKK